MDYFQCPLTEEMGLHLDVGFRNGKFDLVQVITLEIKSLFLDVECATVTWTNLVGKFVLNVKDFAFCIEVLLGL
jgi:hypothetical protein